MSVVCIVETADKGILRSYELAELRLTLEIPAIRSKVKGNVITKDDLAKDIYLLAHVIKNDWGEIEAGFYKFERTSR